MPDITPLHVNGWAITPCLAGGYDMEQGAELHREEKLKSAVLYAQANSRNGPSRIAALIEDGKLDPVRMLRIWHEELAGLADLPPPENAARSELLIARMQSRLMEIVEGAL